MIFKKKILGAMILASFALTACMQTPLVCTSECNKQQLLSNIEKGEFGALTEMGDNYRDGENNFKVNMETAISYYEKAVEHGENIALVRLANIYLYGNNVMPNEDLGKKYLARALAAQVPMAKTVLGHFYQKGLFGYPKDKEKAIKLYQEAFAEGDVEAAYEYAFFIDNKDSKKEWYRKAAEAGSVRGWNAVRWYVENEEKNEETRNRERFRIFQQLALLKDSSAYGALSYTYLNGVNQPGLHVEKNLEEGLRYLKLAAESGNYQSKYDLALRIYNGEGIKKDLNSAVKLISNLPIYYFKGDEGKALSPIIAEGVKEKLPEALRLRGNQYYMENNYAAALPFYMDAAKVNDNYSQYMLGEMYLKGEGVDKNLEMAKKYLLIATDNGIVFSLNDLGNIYYSEGDYQKAYEFYKKAIAIGDSSGYSGLGALYYYGKGVNQDYKKANVAFERIGWWDPNRKLLSDMYFYGQGVEVDYEKSYQILANCLNRFDVKNAPAFFKHYEKLAQKGIPEHQYHLASAYYYGNGTEIDYKKSFYWFDKAAQKNYRDAYYYLGEHYQNGSGVNKDLDKALKWFKTSIEAGNDGYFSIAYIYGLKGESIKSVEWYKKALDSSRVSESDKSVAAYNLGQIYNYGRKGIPIDQKAAFSYYKQSAESDYADAKTKLAFFYFDGKIVEKDVSKGLELLQEAVNAGSEIAKEELGSVYFFGKFDIPKNHWEALRLFEELKENNSSIVFYCLAQLYKEGQVVEADHVKAYRYFKRAYELGDIDSAFYLGYMTANGQGVRKDYYEAAKWYKIGADKKDASAINNLGVLYVKGLGVRKDVKKGKELYGIACDLGNNLACENYAGLE